MPLDVPSGMALEERAFDKVAREALRAAEEVIRGAIPSDQPIPPLAMVEDPLLCIEDLLEEERVDPAISLSDKPPRHASPARTSTHTPPRSTHFAPIILNDGK